MAAHRSRDRPTAAVYYERAHSFRVIIFLLVQCAAAADYSMRKLLLIFAFVACACRAYPFTSVTVSQLENKLAARPAISDAELAQRIGGLKLGERLSEAKFTSMLASLPGPLSQQALVAVADQSEFLPPPKAEIPSIAAPNAAEQSRIVELAAGYLDRTVPTLPDFIATRSTVRYQDRLLTPSNNVNSFETDLPLQLAERSTGAVLYRNHREATVGSVRQGGPAAGKPGGLSTNGTFGPILGTVLADTAHARMQWSRWEQSAAGLVAVFYFTVPQRDSHYVVSYCCVPPGNSRSDSRVDRKGAFEGRFGYRGEMTIDPTSGAILRLVLMAHLASTLPIDVADIFVRYGPVEIGGKTYISPLKSVSVSRARAMLDVKGYNFSFVRGLSVNMLTDTLFTNYNRFRGDVRIVEGDGDSRGDRTVQGMPAEPNGVPDAPQ